MQSRLYRSMSDSQRFAIAWDLSLMLRELALARVQSESPTLSRLELGRKLLSELYPGLIK